MNNRSIPASLAIASVLWAVGLGLIVLGLITKHDFGQLGLAAVCGACTWQVRGYICGLTWREREAFELGKDSVRSIR